jgi:hypothetical protein
MKPLRLLALAVGLSLAACAPADQPEMLWWNIDDLRGDGYIEALQTAPAGSRVEYRFSDSLLHIVTPGVAALQADSTDDDYNFVHVCPPNCP